MVEPYLTGDPEPIERDYRLIDTALRLYVWVIWLTILWLVFS